MDDTTPPEPIPPQDDAFGAALEAVTSNIARRFSVRVDRLVSQVADLTQLEDQIEELSRLEREIAELEAAAETKPDQG